MSNYVPGFDHDASEDRAAVALGWAYWSREWERRRERANALELSIPARAEALRCLRVAAYWLKRLDDGGPAIAPVHPRKRLRCGILSAKEVEAVANRTPTLPKKLFTL